MTRMEMGQVGARASAIRYQQRMGAVSKAWPHQKPREKDGRQNMAPQARQWSAFAETRGMVR
jgi:hypothetical protein